MAVIVSRDLRDFRLTDVRTPIHTTPPLRLTWFSEPSRGSAATRATATTARRVAAWAATARRSFGTSSSPSSTTTGCASAYFSTSVACASRRNCGRSTRIRKRCSAILTKGYGEYIFVKRDQELRWPSGGAVNSSLKLKLLECVFDERATTETSES